MADRQQPAKPFNTVLTSRTRSLMAQPELLLHGTYGPSQRTRVGDQMILDAAQKQVVRC